MLNNQDDLIEEVLKIINAHKIKSNSLKNYFLRNINNNETASQILGYLNELEYDLENLNNLIRNFQLNYSNYNNEINRLNKELNKTRTEINKLKDGNDSIKNKENGNIRINNKGNNSSNKTYHEFNDSRKCENNLCSAVCAYKKNVNNFNSGFDNKIYGRLTYTRSSNESNNFQINKNSMNNVSNVSYFNKKNNKIKKSLINNNNMNINNNVNFDNNIKNNTRNDDIIHLIDNINGKNYTSNFNTLEKEEINKNPINNYNKEKINKNINNYSNNNISLNNNLNNNFDNYNNMKSNNFDNYNNNNCNNLLCNINPIERKNYSSYNLSYTPNIIMNSKRMIPKYNSQNKSFNKKLSEIRKENDDKISRINNILSVISNDENKLNELKSIFGNNIEAQLLNGDINYEYLDKIENYLFMGRNRSIIPFSKRFQIQSRVKSNSIKKSKKNFNNNINNRPLRKKIKDIKHKKHTNKCNTSRDFYVNCLKMRKDPKK